MVTGSSTFRFVQHPRGFEVSIKEAKDRIPKNLWDNEDLQQI